MVWALPRSIATTKGITIVFFSSAYLDVSVQRVRLPYYGITYHYAGLPHSEISGSAVICTSPQLIAAYHVLLRLWEPRHPPYALAYFLTIKAYSKMTGLNLSPLRIAPLASFLYFRFFQYVNELYPFCCSGRQIRRESNPIFTYIVPPGWSFLQKNKGQWLQAIVSPALCTSICSVFFSSLKVTSFKHSGSLPDPFALHLYPLSFCTRSPAQSWTGDLYIISVAL